MQHPVDPNSYDAADPFGSMSGGRTYPHTGSDYAVAYAEVYSVADAVVYHTGWNDGNGNYICCYIPGYDWKDGVQGGLYIAYLHLSSVNVSPQSTVKQGQKIGVSGNTGTNSRGPHLHITMSNSDLAYLGQGAKLDPWAYIQNHLGAPAQAKPPAPKPVNGSKQKKLEMLTARKKAAEAQLKLEQEKLPGLTKVRDGVVQSLTKLTDVFNKAKLALDKATADVVKAQADRVTAETGVASAQTRVASLQKDVVRLSDQISKIK
jgi:septal ring factor EnvC (AmiA/AmiB activator)